MLKMRPVICTQMRRDGLENSVKLGQSGDHLLAGAPPYPQLHPIAAALAP